MWHDIAIVVLLIFIEWDLTSIRRYLKRISGDE
jgi:hypothetical protein